MMTEPRFVGDGAFRSSFTDEEKEDYRGDVDIGEAAGPATEERKGRQKRERL